MVATMREPPNERSPAAGQRDRASNLLTGKVNNPLDSTQAAGFQPSRSIGEVAVQLPRFGRAMIQPLASGNYRPSDDGQWAVILEVRDRHDELADLVAWLPGDPSRWWLRYGDETPILGARDLAFAADCNQPVTLLPTPEAWLFMHSKPNRRAVVCVLDWGVVVGPLFEGVSRVECDSPALCDRFRKALRAWEPKTTSPPPTTSTASTASRGARHAA